MELVTLRRTGPEVYIHDNVLDRGHHVQTGDEVSISPVAALSLLPEDGWERVETPTTETAKE